MLILDSEDALHAILDAIVASCAPVVDALLNEAVYVALGLIRLKSLAIWEQPVLKVAKEWASALEARQVGLAHEHHLNEDDDLLSVGLESLEATGHSVPEIAEGL